MRRGILGKLYQVLFRACNDMGCYVSRLLVGNSLYVTRILFLFCSTV